MTSNINLDKNNCIIVKKLLLDVFNDFKYNNNDNFNEIYLNKLNNLTIKDINIDIDYFKRNIIDIVIVFNETYNLNENSYNIGLALNWCNYDKKIYIKSSPNISQKYLNKINLNDYYDMIYKIINHQLNNKVKQLQCIAVCNNLIKSGFRRPFNLTEDIISQY